MKKLYDLVLWDWNGTLQDDLHHIYECGVQRIFRQFGLLCPSLDVFRNEVTADFMVFYRKFGLPSHVAADELNAIMSEGFKEKGKSADIFPDAYNTVRHMHDHGYHLVLVSAYDSVELQIALDHSGLAPYFQKVLGDVRDKAEVFERLMISYGVASPERTAVIGDSVSDGVAAKKVSATPFLCTRGFHSRERIQGAKADIPSLIITDTLHDLLPHFP